MKTITHLEHWRRNKNRAWRMQGSLLANLLIEGGSVNGRGNIRDRQQGQIAGTNNKLRQWRSVRQILAR
jgi:hypothetical protein